MKEKFLICFSCILLASSAFVGCGNDPPEASNSDNTSATFQEQDETTEPETIEATTEPLTEESADTFDMDKALENTYLCGVQLAPNLTLGMLGESFSVDPEGAVLSPQSGNLSCDVKYKGQYLGVITFKDCESVNHITGDSEIFGILIQNSDTDKFDVPKISVYGVTFNDTHETLYEALGDGYTVRGLNDNVKYCEPDSKRQYDFIFNPMGEDELVTISIMNP